MNTVPQTTVKPLTRVSIFLEKKHVFVLEETFNLWKWAGEAFHGMDIRATPLKSLVIIFLQAVGTPNLFVRSVFHSIMQTSLVHQFFLKMKA